MLISLSIMRQNLIILLIIVAFSLFEITFAIQRPASTLSLNNPIFENYYSFESDEIEQDRFEEEIQEGEGEIADWQTENLSQSPSQSQSGEPTNRQIAKVVKVVDGDTIVLESGQVVRYIGIDTPETSDPRKPVQCFGHEAASKNKELVLGKTIELEKDISETDKYNRLLRYIYIDDLFVNDYLVRNGYAYSSPYPPDVAYQDQLDQAEQEARNNNRGLWSSCPNNIIPSAQKPNNQITQQPENDRDCSDFKTQNEAQLFYEANGGPQSDSHRLDVDKDGIACEGLP